MTLLQDTAENINIGSDITVTLNLNGKTLSTSNYILVEGNLILEDRTATVPSVSEDYETVTYTSGKIKKGTENNAYAIKVQDGGTMVLNSGMVDAGDGINSGIRVAGNGSTLTVNGGYVLAEEYGIGIRDAGAVLTVAGGVVVSENNTAIGGNGSKGQGGTTININGGTLVGHITAPNYIACGIYHPQQGTLNITGGTIYADGGVGVLMRSGDLQMTGGEIIAAGNANASGWVGDNKTQIPHAGIVIDEKCEYQDETETLTAVVSGGTVTGAAGAVQVLPKESGGAEIAELISITGGTFSSDVTPYCAEGYVMNANGEVVQAEPVASVNGETYVRLEDAIANANGGVVQLLQNVILSAPLKTTTDYTLDLNGRTLESAAVYTIDIMDGTVIIDDSASGSGKIKNTAERGYAVICEGNGEVCIENGHISGRYAADVASGGKITINDGVLEGTYAGLRVFGNGGESEGVIKGGSIKSGAYGILIYGANNDLNTGGNGTLTVSGGEIYGKTFGISGNGSTDHTRIVLEGGTITSDGVGIYHPQIGNLTITGDTAITAPNGVQYCGEGTLEITDNAVIHATGKYTEFPSKPSSQGDGSTDDGAALSIISRGSGYQDNGKMKVSITGGELISDHNAAISVYRLAKIDGNWVANDKTTVENYLEKLAITGGKFNGASPKGSLEIDTKAEDALNITGGYYTSDPSNYLEKGYGATSTAEPGYNFEVVAKAEGDVPVKPAEKEPEVAVDQIPSEQQAAVKEALEQVQAPAIVNSANNEAQKITKEEAQKLKDSSEIVAGKDEEITLYTQAFLDIKAESYDVEEESKKELRLDIEPKFQIVASTAKIADDIDLKDSEHSKVVQQPQPLKVTTPIQITMDLPDEFVTDKDTPVYVRHTKKDGKAYLYDTAVSSRQDSDDVSKTIYSIAFTNPNGFSSFTITTEDGQAYVNGTYYPTVADAVAAANGATVTLLKDVGDVDIAEGNAVLDLNGYSIVKLENKSTLTITDSTNKGKVTGAVNSTGSLKIQNGIFEGALSGNISITGGTFVEDPSGFLASGYEAKPSGGKYVVSRIPTPSYSSNNYLSALTVDQGSLTPAFDRNTLEYTVTVGNEVTSLNVTPVKEHYAAWVQVNGVTVTTANPSVPVALVEGSNTITIKVIAESGAVKNYVITVTREQEPEITAPAPVTVKVTNKTTDSVTIQWTESEGAEGYTIWTRAEGETSYKRRYIHHGNEDLTYTWKNKRPGKKYFFIVKAWVQDEEGKYLFSEASKTVRGTTKPLTAVIDEVVVNANGDMKVRLAEAAKGATHYAMCWSRHEDWSKYKIGMRTVYTTRTMEKGMKPGTYYVKVRSYRQLETSRVYGDWSEAVKVVVK